MKKRFRLSSVYYSIQGEGVNTGQSTLFVRFHGCNLKCPFCDTRTHDNINLSVSELVDLIKNMNLSKWVTFTGGEPTLQLFTLEGRELLEKLKVLDYYITIETNGTIPDLYDCIKYIDWITLSPKNRNIKLDRMDEIKIVYHPFTSILIPFFDKYKVPKYIQPDDNRNIKETVEFVKKNPKWRLSLQTHKLGGFE